MQYVALPRKLIIEDDQPLLLFLQRASSSEGLSRNDLISHSHLLYSRGSYNLPFYVEFF